MRYPNMMVIDAAPIISTRLPGECGWFPQKAIARRKAITQKTNLTRKIHVQNFFFNPAVRNHQWSNRRSMPLPSGITTLSSYPRARERMKARFNLAESTLNQAKRRGNMSWNR